MEYWDNKNILEKIVRKSTSELSDGDIIFLKKLGIINGCGGNIRNDCGNMITKILAKISKKIAKKLRPMFFEASCDLHDFGYWVGGDEERRKECDEKFYEKILEDIERYFVGKKDEMSFSEKSLKTIPLFLDKKWSKNQVFVLSKNQNSLRSNSWFFYRTATPKILINLKYFLQKMYFKILAKIFYIAVRIGGKQFFHYTRVSPHFVEARIR